MRSLIFGLMLSVFAVSAYGEEDPFARDLKIITEWFEGEFDNEEQLWFQWRSGVPEDDRHLRLHVIHKRWDAPQFGEHVFYVEEYKENDPDDIVRQRIVIFSSDPEENAIRMRQGFFRDQDAVKGAHFNPSLLEDITEEDVFFMDVCDVFWQRKADQFEGAMKPKACKLGAGGGPPRYSVHNLTLSANKYWRVDSSFREDDDTLYIGTPVDEPHEMRRSRIFSCDVYFRGTLDGGPERGVEHVLEDLRLHSQGGTILATNPQDGEQYQIMMREKEYNFYADRPDFMYFSLRKPGELMSISFGVHDAASRMLGLNVGWMSAFCHQEGYTFREHWAELPKAP